MCLRSDLLLPAGEQTEKLHIRNDELRGIYVAGLTEEIVTTAEEVLALLAVSE